MIRFFRLPTFAGTFVQLFVICAFGLFFSKSATAQLTDLHDFSALTNGTNYDGCNPAAVLVQGNDGNFYGATTGGEGYTSGSDEVGSIFKISPAGVFTTLHFFSVPNNNGVNSDGDDPNGLTLGTDGNFYGTTIGGGAFGLGTVFRITSAGTLTTLYSFGTTGTDGAYPKSTLVEGSDGNFYGTTYGINLQDQEVENFTVFKITPSGVLSTLHIFSGGQTDGSASEASLI